MKMKSILWAGITATAVCLALPASLRADDQDKTSGAGSSEKTDCYHHEMGSSTQTEKLGTPTDLNKASHIIGMRVENQNGDRLGKIKDIVFNWQAGQASYAVLSKSNPAKGTGKYVAVPLTAFKPSTNEKHLVLNVDKNRVENAKGFAENNWPALGSTAFGASSEEIILNEERTPTPSDRLKEEYQERDQD